MGWNRSTTFARSVINVFPLSWFTFASFRGSLSAIDPVHTLFEPLPTDLAHRVLLSMAPVVLIEPNGSQDLSLFDNARKDLENSGWLVFIQRSEGFNICVAQQFALTFDGCRDKICDIQLELNEEFLSSATGLVASGERCFKNSKVDEVPWPLLFVSRNFASCDKGMPISTLKPRWHDLLVIVKQFVTCEGQYGMVFLYHLRLLMNFMGYPLNMPHYFLPSLYKMSKRFKRKKADSSLFHHSLINLIVVHHLSLHGNNWQAFLSRNGFANLELVQIDKAVVCETMVGPPVPFHILLPPVKPSVCPDINLPDIITNPCTKDKTKAVKKPVKKKGNGDTTVNNRGKKNTWLISRYARNKPKPNVDQKPIVLSEDSDSDIECFLAEEYPYSHGLWSTKPYDYVSNLSPCLKNNLNYPGIKLHDETPGDLNKPSSVISKPEQPSCIQCNAWIEHYYNGIPLLQSKVKALEEHVTVLAKENHRLQANEKRQKTTGLIVFRNVEAATAFINSKLSWWKPFLTA